MNAGALNKLLTVQVKTDGEDDMGAPTEAWADLYTGIPCAIQNQGSREFPANLKRNSEATVRFVIRYRAGIDTADHQITTVDDYDASPVVTREWNIFPPYDADPDHPRHWLAIEASEVI